MLNTGPEGFLTITVTHGIRGVKDPNTDPTITEALRQGILERLVRDVDIDRVRAFNSFFCMSATQSRMLRDRKLSWSDAMKKQQQANFVHVGGVSTACSADLGSPKKVDCFNAACQVKLSGEVRLDPKEGPFIRTAGKLFSFSF